MIPDAHCHLDQLDDADGAVAEAEAAGTGPILAVSMDSISAERILILRQRHPGLVLAGIGLHPSRVPEILPDEMRHEMRRLEALLPSADFIGEIGLDHKDALTEEDRARQREALSIQLGWAEECRLPVNLHSRRADREVLEAAIAFRERTGLGALMHWFTHSKKLARLCALQGIFISAGPSVLIDPSTAGVAAQIADAILLVETDSPVEYGAQGPARPSWAPRVLARLAELRGVTSESLVRIVGGNLSDYLGRPAQAP